MLQVVLPFLGKYKKDLGLAFSIVLTAVIAIYGIVAVKDVDSRVTIVEAKMTAEEKVMDYLFKSSSNLSSHEGSQAAIHFVILYELIDDMRCKDGASKEKVFALGLYKKDKMDMLVKIGALTKHSEVFSFLAEQMEKRPEYFSEKNKQLIVDMSVKGTEDKLMPSEDDKVLLDTGQVAIEELELPSEPEVMNTAKPNVTATPEPIEEVASTWIYVGVVDEKTGGIEDNGTIESRKSLPIVGKKYILILDVFVRDGAPAQTEKEGVRELANAIGYLDTGQWVEILELNIAEIESGSTVVWAKVVEVDE